MTRLFVVGGLTLALAGHPHARAPQARTPSPSPPPPPHAQLRPAEPLPMLARIARVRVAVGHDRLIVLEEVSLPRGEWTSGGLELYVAFGAPGAPVAVDAQVIPLAQGAAESSLDDTGEPVAVEPATRRPAEARLLLGKAQMAGVTVRLKEAQMRHIFETGESAALRIRSLLPLPAADAAGARDAVVRLGVAGGLPLTLGHVEVESLEPALAVARAEAKLCGPDADEWPLSVSILPKAPPARIAATPSIAPVAAVRHASDDLCVRWWTPG